MLFLFSLLSLETSFNVILLPFCRALLLKESSYINRSILLSPTAICLLTVLVYTFSEILNFMISAKIVFYCFTRGIKFPFPTEGPS